MNTLTRLTPFLKSLSGAIAGPIPSRMTTVLAGLGNRWNLLQTGLSVYAFLARRMEKAKLMDSSVNLKAGLYIVSKHMATELLP